MKKKDLIDMVAERAETSKAAVTRVFDALFDAASGAISEAVRAGENVSIPGFGKFRTKTRPARKGRNPQRGAEIDIPERKVVQFAAGKGLHEAVRSPGGKTARKAPTKSAAAAKGAAPAKRASTAKSATAKSSTAEKGAAGAKSAGAAKPKTAPRGGTGAAKKGGASRTK
jgi:nucleoid DNA-binding protein